MKTELMMNYNNQNAPQSRRTIIDMRAYHNEVGSGEKKSVLPLQNMNLSDLRDVFTPNVFTHSQQSSGTNKEGNSLSKIPQLHLEDSGISFFINIYR